MINKILKRGIVFASFYCIVSCNTQHDHGKVATYQNSEPIVVHIDSKKIKPKNMWDDIKTLNIIPLETSRESLISGILDIQFKKNNLFILDKNRQNLLLFDTTGNFIKSIGGIGNGPGEHREIRHFHTDDDFIYISSVSKLSKYAWNGDLIEENSFFSPAVNDFSVFNDSLFLYYSLANSGDMDDLGMSHYLQLKNFKGVPITNYLQYNGNKKLLDLRGYNNNMYRTNNNETRIVYNTNDTVFTIGYNTISPTYVVDFGRQKLKKNMILDDLRKFEEWKTGQYAFNVGLTNISETSDYLYFNYLYGTKFMHALYNKKNQVTDLYDRFIVDNQKIFIRGVANENFIGILNPDNSSLKYNLKNVYPKNYYDVKEPEIGDNPVILIFSIMNQSP